MQLDHAFMRHVTRNFGDGEAETLIKAIESGVPETSIRINPAKPGSLDLIPGDMVQVPWNKLGFYLSARPRFTFDPALHQGRYYVQEASSMFAGYVAECIVRTTGDRPLRVLDACAAPGGKTLAIADMLPAGSTVIANEYDRQRAAVLVENVAKWGNPSVIVTQGDTAQFRKMRHAFDIIIVDAPCSGEGMMRKDPKAVEQWSETLVEQCAGRQRDILDNLIGCLAPGGFLIYSTCTYNAVENEEIVSYLTDNYDLAPVDIPVDANWGILSADVSGVSCLHFLPSRLRGEGLFMAVMKAEGELEGMRDASTTPRKSMFPEIAQWAPSLVMKKYTDTVYGLPAHSVRMLKDLEAKSVNVISPGVAVATVKGRDFIPAGALALSTAFDATAFPSVEVDYDMAISFLRHEMVTLPSATPRGHVLLTFGSYPIGFVKNLGNRANNLYPVHWRIRS